MAFENLSEKLQGVFHKLRGKGKISESDLKDAMREVKLALLEADVNFKVVKDFIAKVSEKAKGTEVLESLTPGQMIVKIVSAELAELMGGSHAKITISPKPPTVVMMVGLQGAGKTTTSGKLGGVMRKQGKKPLLVACDVYRPAAIEQLGIVAKQLDLPFFKIDGCMKPVEIAQKGIQHAILSGLDFVIIDTAGRLHIDEALMAELQAIKSNVSVTETLLVVDAMTGQDVVNVADSFNSQLEIDGVILTKLDGDARGGAALSVRAATSKPIKFIGVGEKLGDLEPFHPERMAQRILGMGDVMTLVEKAEEIIDLKKAEELERKLRNNQFTLEDYLEQMGQMKNMGPLDQLLGMIPGVNSKMLAGLNIDEKKMARTEAIIKSMTRDERIRPDIINSSRKQRIAAGSGVHVSDVNVLLKQFDAMNQMMKSMNKSPKGGMGNMFGNMGIGKKGKKKFPF